MFVRALAWGVGGGVVLASLEAAYEANTASFGVGLLMASLLTFAVLGMALFLLVACCGVAQRLLWRDATENATGDAGTDLAGDVPARAS